MTKSQIENCKNQLSERKGKERNQCKINYLVQKPDISKNIRPKTPNET